MSCFLCCCLYRKLKSIVGLLVQEGDELACCVLVGLVVRVRSVLLFTRSLQHVEGEDAQQVGDEEGTDEHGAAVKSAASGGHSREVQTPPQNHFA